MCHRWPALMALGIVLSVSSFSFADDGGESGADAKSEASTGDESEGDTGKRRDPEGIQGISPFMEIINEGNAAYIARDYATATAKYQEALQKKPNGALGHYMLGQALLAEGKLKEANDAWQSALRFAEKKPALKAKALFVIADLRERQKQWDAAAEAWKAYASYVGANQNARGYPNTPNARLQALDERKELETKYAKVKERIAQREKDAAAKAKKQ